MSSKDKSNIEFTDELRRKVEKMTSIQRKYFEYRGRGLNQPDSAEKAGSQASDRQALSRVGYNWEATVDGGKEYMAYLQAVKAEAACVDDLEVIEGLRAVVREAMASNKYADANKALELLGNYIGMFGKNKGQEVNQGKEDKVIKNNVGAFKDEGEDLQDRAKKLGSLLKDLNR